MQITVTEDSGESARINMPVRRTESVIDFINHRYPTCLVWTPIPLLTWFFPFIGHLGICTSSGIIKDFAGPYSIGVDKLAFGDPKKYVQLYPEKAVNGVEGWDCGVKDACEEYKNRMHNLFCDNCHSHVAMALNQMKYDNSNWNMVKLAALVFFKGKYVGFSGFVHAWLPFLIIVFIIVTLCMLT